jgi:hypothetical protein
MPPKAKAQHAPKLKTRPARKARASSAPQPSPHDSQPDIPHDSQSSKNWADGGSELSGPKRRRVERRDTEDQVERVIATRLLPQFRLEDVNGIVSAAGEHIRPYLARHIHDNKSGAKYLTSRFWTQFFKVFDLKVQGLSGVPEPQTEEEVSDALTRAMQTAHHDNPAQRSVEPLERLLETMLKPNYLEFFGLVQCAQEAPTMSRPSSLRLKMAILSLVARLFWQMLCILASPLLSKY